MKEVPLDEHIEKAEFVFSREFMIMNHNYLCAICKKEPAVIETWRGVLQPCWGCQKKWKVYKRGFLLRVLDRMGLV